MTLHAKKNIVVSCQTEIKNSKFLLRLLRDLNFSLSALVTIITRFLADSLFSFNQTTA